MFHFSNTRVLRVARIMKQDLRSQRKGIRMVCSRYNTWLMAALGAAFLFAGCRDRGSITTQEHEKRNVMKFGYTLLYVRDVAETLEFFERAFGLKRKFLHVDEDKGYGELNTGTTTLGFVSHAQARSVGIEFVEQQLAGPAQAVEIGFVTDDVASAYEKAVDMGATPVASPSEKPWGQTVSYVRDINGFLVEVCSEVTAK